MFSDSKEKRIIARGRRGQQEQFEMHGKIHKDRGSIGTTTRDGSTILDGTIDFSAAIRLLRSGQETET